MAGSHLTDLLPELVRRGLVADSPSPAPLPRGNRDRRDTLRESGSWIVQRPDGARLRLSFGPGLLSRAKLTRQLAQDCPSLVAAPVFAESISDVEVVAEPFFDGSPLETAWRESLIPRETCERALHLARQLLEKSSRLSTAEARNAEWQAWTERLLAAPVWAPEIRGILAADVLPELARRLDSAPPTTRWTNGDFTASNLLLDAAGTPRLVDLEYAQRTHFFGEDTVRFNTLARAAWDQDALLLDAPEDADLTWHLYFWLRQFQLEAEQNSAEFLARMQEGRIATIRLLAEHVLGRRLVNWPRGRLAIDHRLEQAHWLPQHSMTVLLGGWCRVTGDAGVRSMMVLGDGRRLALAGLDARPDVLQHFPDDSRSAQSGYALHIPLRRLETDLALCAALENGALLPVVSLAAGSLPRGVAQFEDYLAWASRYDPDPPARPSAIPADGPLFSVLVPVHRPPREVLVDCLESVRRQHYPRWELRLVDDGMSSPEITTLLRDLAREDPRVHVTFRKAQGGISRATNDALAAAQGEFIVLLDHDDVLRPHALTEFAAALGRKPDLDVLYSDEDKLDADGRRVVPLPKPAFSPEFLLGVMYIGHALCVRTSLARDVGGFDPTFDGVQDYDFFLRLTERTKKIGHIPRMLYHWRQSAASSALIGNVKGDMDALQIRAVENHLRRRGDLRRVMALSGHRIRVFSDLSGPLPRCGLVLTWADDTFVPAGFWDTLAALGIPIWTAAGVQCPTGIAARSSARADAPSIVAEAARSGDVDVLLLLGLPFIKTSPDWLAHLSGCAQLADSGAVAPLLLDGENRVLESGWTVGAAGYRPVMRGYDPDGDGAHGSLPCTREVAAISHHCLAINSELVRKHPPGSDDWLGYCHGLLARGFHNRVCTAARVTLPLNWRETEAAIAAAPVGSDPYFNPHFDADHADYRLASPPAHFSAERSDFRWHLDVPPKLLLPDGALRVLGWIVHAGDMPVTVRAHVAGLTWSVPATESRPDVARLVPQSRAAASGFRLNLRVPPGRHLLQLVAEIPAGPSEQLWVGLLEVSPRALLRRAWVRGPDSTASYQMLAAPSHAPGPLRIERLPRLRPGRARPRLAVVTPSFNQAAFLAETMDSVLGQETALAYVVQDGGSTDGSPDLIRARAGRLHAWESAPDRGQADAIARGFAKTSGGPNDLMAWINSDDTYLPGALAFVADYFARHPDVDALYGHRILIDEQSREVGRWFMPPHRDDVLRLADFVPQETLFWRRRLWEKVGGLDPSLQFAMDWDLLLRFTDAGAKIVRVPYFLACFRLHPAQKTSAAMHHTGQKEIDRLRTRTHGREIPPAELESDPRLLRYLRRSAFIEWLWSLGIRAP